MNNPTINTTIDSVIDYLNIKGIQVQREALLNYIIKKQPSSRLPAKPKFKVVSKPKFKIKTTLEKPKPKLSFIQFTDICVNKNLKFFRFYDENNWTGPAIKVLEDEFDTVIDYFNYDDILVLPGYGFSVFRPQIFMSDENINYEKENFNSCRFTDTPLIPCFSDNDSESESETEEDDTELDDEFLAEEWTYDGVTYLLDMKTNYVYSPETQEFMGKKTGEFSIDFNAKEI